MWPKLELVSECSGRKLQTHTVNSIFVLYARAAQTMLHLLNCAVSAQQRSRQFIRTAASLKWPIHTLRTKPTLAISEPKAGFGGSRHQPVKTVRGWGCERALVVFAIMATPGSVHK